MDEVKYFEIGQPIPLDELEALGIVAPGTFTRDTGKPIGTLTVTDVDHEAGVVTVQEAK